MSINEIVSIPFINGRIILGIEKQNEIGDRKGKKKGIKRRNIMNLCNITDETISTNNFL
jgi:hypothetical protein